MWQEPLTSTTWIMEAPDTSIFRHTVFRNIHDQLNKILSLHIFLTKSLASTIFFCYSSVKYGIPSFIYQSEITF